jgi:spermidine/putrescine ABC transporter ATP-binding subunit
MSGVAHMRSEGASVRLVDIVKDYGSVRAVDHVSLEIRAGEFLALLGPSGSGKTTILMAIAGFERTTSGEIHIGDRRIDQVPPHHRGIGMVFQRYALFPHMSVADNVAFPLKMRRVTAAERRQLVEEALQLVRLEGYGSRQPNQLSGGQQQRVALARAIVYKPPVLLMDEPLGALDRKLREELQLELRGLQQELGTTVVYVTHDQGEALTMADRIAVIHEGQLRQLGSPRELYERPASVFVAGFVGETNLIEGTVVQAGSPCVVRVGSGDELRITVRGERPLEPGQPVRVAVRPERIVLRPGDGSAPGGLRGTVAQVVYVGDAVRYQLRVEGVASLQVKVPTGSDPGLAVGDAAGAIIEPDVAQVFSRAGER